MPGKIKECLQCGKLMRSDNLKLHMKKCSNLPSNITSKHHHQDVHSSSSKIIVDSEEHEHSECGRRVMPINYNLQWKDENTIVKSPNLNAKEKALMHKFGELYELFDQLKQWGIFNKEEKEESLHNMLTKIMDMLNILAEEREEMSEA